MDVEKINRYVALGMAEGYPGDIPDEVPLPLMQQRLAPSYRAIALAILKNDHALTTLGFSAPVSKWYGVLKREELGIALPSDPKIKLTNPSNIL